MTKDYIDFNDDWNYPLQWLEESRVARMQYHENLYRVNLAMVGRPSVNLYKAEVESNLRTIPDEDMSTEEKNRCLDIPEGQSFILAKAVDTIANQMASGVDTYEYQIDDPYMLIDDDTEELLAAKCQQDYVENQLELFAPTFSRDLKRYGMTAVMVKYNPKDDSNSIYRINPKNTWFDTRYTSTGQERFRGYSTMVSFSALAKMIEHDQDQINYNVEVPDKSVFNKAGTPDPRIKIGRNKITTVNDLAIYIEDLNKLAASPSLQGGVGQYWEYAHDLRDCYNLNYYHTYATDAEARTKSGYNGDDVELTILYDLTRKIEFKIINRRFVISANKKAFRRNVAFPIVNPITGETRYRVDEFCLDCPLKFRFEDPETRDYYPYPTSKLFSLLSLHDQLCAWRSKRDHVTKLVSILRIETNGADADSLRRAKNIMGYILDDVEGDVNTIKFDYNYEPIDSQIAYLESTISAQLNAYTQFDAMQMMGDRASAAESGMAIGAIAQGLSIHQNTIMALYADIARQCIANRVAYSPRSEFPVNNLGNYSSITIQQMALNAVIRVKSKMARKVNEKTLSASALTLLGTMKDMLTPEGVAYLGEQAMMGQMPRRLAKTFIKEQGASDQEIANATLQAQNQAQMLQQNQSAYEANPVDYEANNVMEQLSPEEVDQVIDGINAEAGNMGVQPQEQPEGGISPEMLDMQSQEGAMQTGLEGLTSDSGSAFANPNSLV